MRKLCTCIIFSEAKKVRGQASQHMFKEFFVALLCPCDTRTHCPIKNPSPCLFLSNLVCTAFPFTTVYGYISMLLLKIILLLLTESRLVLGVTNVFINSFLQPSRTITRNSDQVASIAVLWIFKNTTWVQKALTKQPVWKGMWLSQW